MGAFHSYLIPTERHAHLPQGNTKLQQETMETISEMTTEKRRPLGSGVANCVRPAWA